jgi:hypothetical protein
VPFDFENLAATAVRPDRAALKAFRQRRAEVLEDHLYKLALEAEREEVQVQAATRLHAIYEGLPVARVINTTVDDVGAMSDDALRDELARLGGEAASAAAGTASQGMPGKPEDVVH